MPKAWDGHERRVSTDDGREGRRQADWHCSEHFIIQEATKDHRVTVCGKIANLKIDSEKDLAALKAHHDKDLNEVKTDMDKKADKSDIRGMIRLVSVLVAICCAIVAGQAIWLKSDISKVSSEVAAIAPSIQRVNVRISESMNDRIKTDFEQTQKLESIAGQIGTVNWRLTQIEESHKIPNKFVPDKPNGKVN
jgi:hypothetical protein